MREFCVLSRDSVSLPAGVFSNGMLLNAVPMPLPTLVVR